MDTRSLLSTKSISPPERLIFALDVPNADEARRLVDELGDAIRFYKLGLELFMSEPEDDEEILTNENLNA